MSVVYFSLLLFVRIEQNVKIYNTLHLVLLFDICDLKRAFFSEKPPFHQMSEHNRDNINTVLTM